MKGQAWNVLEVLKASDQGPLELTRRARVYVWDDIVELPIALPLHPPSDEMRRRGNESLHDVGGNVEELDITTVSSSNLPPQYDLLDLGHHSSDLPNPNRFVLPRASTDSERRSDEQGRYAISPKSPATVDGTYFGGRRGTDDNTTSRYEIRRSRYSFASRRRSSGALYDDDLGDIGYAAAEGLRHRKAICERLEQVKSKNPVFTWC